MKVIFLDFDGVLNSQASFILESTKRKSRPQTSRKLCPVNETLCHVCTSNFQIILEKVPDAKIVISSTWREVYELGWLKKKLNSYGVDSSRVIDKTPVFYSRSRGHEINEWLEGHPEVTTFVIIDDCEIGNRFTEKEIVKTSWDTGLLLPHVYKALKILGEDDAEKTMPY